MAFIHDFSNRFYSNINSLFCERFFLIDKASQTYFPFYTSIFNFSQMYENSFEMIMHILTCAIFLSVLFAFFSYRNMYLPTDESNFYYIGEKKNASQVHVNCARYLFVSLHS